MYTVKVIEDKTDYEEEQVYPCDRYERTRYKGDVNEQYKEGNEEIGAPIPRSADTAWHHLRLFINGEQSQVIQIPHSVLDKPKKKHIYIMNEQGKTIDSY